MLTAGYVEPVPPMVSVGTMGWGWIQEGVSASDPASATYEAANRGIYTSVFVPSVCVARRMWWANGAAAVGNVEAGIYADAGHKPGAKLITTGSVAQSGTSVIQFTDITDTTLSPGLWWLYISCSSTSSSFFRWLLISVVQEVFRFQQDSIGPGSAPTTATPVEASGQSVYLFGFSTTTIT